MDRCCSIYYYMHARLGDAWVVVWQCTCSPCRSRSIAKFPGPHVCRRLSSVSLFPRPSSPLALFLSRCSRTLARMHCSSRSKRRGARARHVRTCTSCTDLNHHQLQSLHFAECVCADDAGRALTRDREKEADPHQLQLDPKAGYKGR